MFNSNEQTSFANKMNLWINLTPLFISLFITLFIFIFGRFLPPKLPLFYSLPWGDSQLVNHQQLLIIPSIITLIALLNLTVSWHLHSSQIFFKKILLSSSILISLILTITFLKIIVIFI